MGNTRRSKIDRFTLRSVIILTICICAYLDNGRLTTTALARTDITVTVNTSGDASDFNIYDNYCDTDPASAGAQCTLRAALEFSNSNQLDKILFDIPASEPNCNASGQCTINLTGALPEIRDMINIEGPGAERLTVRRDTGGNYGIFRITAQNGNVIISGMTVSNGYSAGTDAEEGGAIDSGTKDMFTNTNGARVDVRRCVITGTQGPGGRGSAIAERGNYMNIVDTMVIDNGVRGIYAGGHITPGPSIVGVMSISGSTISRNGTTGSGGGIYSRIQIYITNSTISDNGAYLSGGGIFRSYLPPIIITSSTITRNYSADADGTIENSAVGISSGASLINTIVVGNYRLTPGSPNFDVGEGVYSNGHNIIGTVTDPAFTPKVSDQIGVSLAQVNLGLLRDNGGPTLTIAPGPGSIALDKGTTFTQGASYLTLDQRGSPRVYDYPGIPNAEVEGGASGADVGAVEVRNTVPRISSGSLSRQRGAAGYANIADVSDAEDGTGVLSVSVNGGSSATASGVTVSNIFIDRSGFVTARVAAACNATTATFTLTVTDSGGWTSTATLRINVTASNPPVITLAALPRAALANGAYRTLAINDMVQSTSDDCDGNLQAGVVVEKATSDEADNAPGTSDGNTTNDIVILSYCRSVNLRMERDTNLDGRVYNVVLKVTDSDGQTTRATYKVGVSASAFGSPAVEGKAVYSVNGGCP